MWSIPSYGNHNMMVIGALPGGKPMIGRPLGKAGSECCVSPPGTEAKISWLQGNERYHLPTGDNVIKYTSWDTLVTWWPFLHFWFRGVWGKVPLRVKQGIPGQLRSGWSATGFEPAYQLFSVSPKSVTLPPGLREAGWNILILNERSLVIKRTGI